MRSFRIRINSDAHSMAAAGYDGDGDLDLRFAHWGNAWSGRPTHSLWRNNGRGRHENDGDPDLFVTNGWFGEPRLGAAPERPVILCRADSGERGPRDAFSL